MIRMIVLNVVKVMRALCCVFLIPRSVEYHLSYVVLAVAILSLLISLHRPGEDNLSLLAVFANYLQTELSGQADHADGLAELVGVVVEQHLVLGELVAVGHELRSDVVEVVLV